MVCEAGQGNAVEFVYCGSVQHADHWGAAADADCGVNAMDWKDLDIFISGVLTAAAVIVIAFMIIALH